MSHANPPRPSYICYVPAPVCFQLIHIDGLVGLSDLHDLKGVLFAGESDGSMDDFVAGSSHGYLRLQFSLASCSKRILFNSTTRLALKIVTAEHLIFTSKAAAFRRQMVVERG